MHPGFGPWSTKDDVPHVQPPVKFLEQMLTVSIIWMTRSSQWCLTHFARIASFGRLVSERIQSLRNDQPMFCVSHAAGDAVLVRPVFLHASSRSTSNRHRRVLHLEYAAFELPPELQWHEAA